MALEVDLPADKNPHEDSPRKLYVRASGLTINLDAGSIIAPFSAFASKAAARKGKEPLARFSGVQVGPQALPPAHDRATGKKIRDAIPSSAAVLKAFSDEFNAVREILYVAGQRYDPELAAGTVPAEDVIDPARVAAINAKLDQLEAEVTGE